MSFNPRAVRIPAPVMLTGAGVFFAGTMSSSEHTSPNGSSGNAGVPKPADKMNVYELRRTISDLLREDFVDRLAELHRRLDELFQELEKKESSPPRSDFFDLRVLILKENQSNYNRINNAEAIGALWCALKLQHVGKPDEMSLACRRGAEYGEPVIHISDFVISEFPEKLQRMCAAFFRGVHTFEFF